MTAANLLAVALAGALGALCRFWIVSSLPALSKSAFPLGTFTVNLLGCLCVGLAWAALEQSTLAPWVRLAIVTGGLGAFTTFSTFALDSLQLLQQGHYKSALLYLMLSNFLGLFLASIGWITGRHIFQ